MTKQKTYQMPVYFFSLLGFFVNHVIGPLADYTVSFFGWQRISEIGQLKRKKKTNDLLWKKILCDKKAYSRRPMFETYQSCFV